MPWTDAHAHIWTPDTHAYPVVREADGHDRAPRDFTPEVLLRHARPSGIGRSVLVQAARYGTDNSYVLDSVERFPALFRAVASVDVALAGDAGEMATLRERGISGLRVVAPAGAAGQWLDGRGYDAMFGVAAEVGHAICVLTRPHGLTDVSRMCTDHPSATVVVDHMAMIGESGSIEDADVEALVDIARHLSTYVKVSGLHALGQKGPPHDELAPTIKSVVEAFGPERVMWGSDSPYQVVDESYEDSIIPIRDRLDFLTDTDRQQLLSGTANKVFFPPSPQPLTPSPPAHPRLPGQPGVAVADTGQRVFAQEHELAARLCRHGAVGQLHPAPCLQERAGLSRLLGHRRDAVVSHDGGSELDLHPGGHRPPVLQKRHSAHHLVEEGGYDAAVKMPRKALMSLSRLIRSGYPIAISLEQ